MTPRVTLAVAAAGLELLTAGCSSGGNNGNSTIAIAAIGPLTGSAEARGKDRSTTMAISRRGREIWR